MGGFVYVISVLMSMEGCLSPRNLARYQRKDEENVFQLLRSVFTCLAVAMRYEPANAHFFNVEVLGFRTYVRGQGLNDARTAGHNFVETILNLGCFSTDNKNILTKERLLRELQPVTLKPKDEI